MADWYEVEEAGEVAHVRATNTRTAFDRGFRLLCGMNYKLPPGQKMTITVLRLRGGTDKVKLLEKVYQETRAAKKKRGRTAGEYKPGKYELGSPAEPDPGD